MSALASRLSNRPGEKEASADRYTRRRGTEKKCGPGGVGGGRRGTRLRGQRRGRNELRTIGTIERTIGVRAWRNIIGYRKVSDVDYTRRRLHTAGRGKVWQWNERRRDRRREKSPLRARFLRWNHGRHTCHRLFTLTIYTPERRSSARVSRPLRQRPTE